MGKNLFIAEKPSVAREFANALKISTASRDGYLEADDTIVTWCVGHLVTMSYPEVYDEKYRRWSFDTIPFLPEEFKYEVIDGTKKQYTIVSSLMNRKDVSTIYVCTDSGREGEYIYRLVEQMANIKDKKRLRVWIDSQTEEEILRGIREAKDLQEYDHLSDAAYLRAKEDYLMGINFSRALTLKYGRTVKDYLKRDKAVISVGRVMTCVLGIVVNREREIRNFVKTPFYRVLGTFKIQDRSFQGEWRAVGGEGVAPPPSAWYASPKLYKENGFKKEEDAKGLIAHLEEEPVGDILLESISRKKENRNPPLLYNLAELQNDCSKMFKISPDETLRIVQELYEKKMVTYPRTDARVLSTAVAKEIHKNIGGLRGFGPGAGFAAEILNNGSYKGIAKTRYVNDKQITDHYAIIPTGQGLNNLNSLPPLSAMDVTLCMGASVSGLHGFLKARPEEAGKAVGVIGDSTFVHSGITGLIDTVYNKGLSTVIILDNSITGMTGHQENPTTGRDIHRQPAPQLSIEGVCQAVGVEKVLIADPGDLPAMEAAVREALAWEGAAVVIARRPCALLKGVKRLPPVRVEESVCIGCRACMRIGCPAISFHGGRAHIDETLCVGCGLCVGLCPKDAIKEGAK